MLTPRAAAAALGLSETTLRRLRAAGTGPRMLRLSDRRLGYRREDLEAWLAQRPTA